MGYTKISHTGSLQLYLWQVSDVHLHVAALAGPVQPLHVHIQRPGTQDHIRPIVAGNSTLSNKSV